MSHFKTSSSYADISLVTPVIRTQKGGFWLNITDFQGGEELGCKEVEALVK